MLSRDLFLCGGLFRSGSDPWSVYGVIVTAVAFVLSINNLESHGMFLTAFFHRIFENLEVQIVVN